MQITLPEEKYTVKWVNLRTGEKLQERSTKIMTGGRKVSLGMPPVEDGMDWVVVVRK
jgi:hypothetical protein